MPVERIAAFIRGESTETFDELARAVSALQYRRIAAWRELCERRQATPDRLSDWRQAPPLPESELAGLADGEAARDAAYRALQRDAIERSFATACLEGIDRPPLLCLVPPGGELADPGLAVLADSLLRSLAAADSLVAARRGVEVAKARSFLAARQRDRRPTVVLGATAAIRQLLDALGRRGLRFRLPPGSRVVAAGRGAPADRTLLAGLGEALAVPPEAVLSDYGIAGLTTRYYAGYGRLGEPRPFQVPPWARVRLLDPDSLTEVPTGAEGRIAIFDLASAGEASHVLAEDLGVAEGGGFRLSPGPPPVSS